jgi:hypothetical protein
MKEGERKGCGLYPILFNKYIPVNKVLQEWKTTTKSGIKLSQDRKINTMLYADDKVLIAKSENELQKAANALNKNSKKYKLEISETKAKTKAICGNNSVRARIE